MSKAIMVAIVSGLFSVSAYASPPMTVADVAASVKMSTATCMPSDAATVKKVEVKSIADIKKLFRGIHLANPASTTDMYAVAHSAGAAGKDATPYGPLGKDLTAASFKSLIGAKSCAPGG